MTQAYQSLNQIDLKSISQESKDFFAPVPCSFPSPTAWEDRVFYFLMLDRFSDDNENGYKDNHGNLVQTGTTPMFTEAARSNAIKTEADAAHWRDAGTKYVGGKLKGVTSKIGYLKRLGVNAIWISPIFKQVEFQDTYHGYGIQNFLEVDPHFGSRDDLRDLVKVAHENGIHVILDIILNHTGNVFSYENSDTPWNGNPYKVQGFNDLSGHPTLPFTKTDPKNLATWPQSLDSVWPVEFQDPAVFTCKGHISNWDYDPEFREGDFCDLKDVHHGTGDADNYQVAPGLRYLCEVYKFWIAYADLDGFRIDTVKHMDIGATRFFASAIHEFAQSLGKDQFFLVGEITGGRERAFHTRELTGLDAALGIDDIPDKLEYLVKGWRNPNDYFSLFRNSVLLDKDSHTWLRDKVVTMYDDHDQVRKGGEKARFCADPDATKVALNVLALNAMTLGIPCIYYGSEQGFDGQGGSEESDRYIREAMFGGEFGAFRSKGMHFFDEDCSIYRELAQILDIRSQHITLKRGRQYLREISAPEDGVKFGLPQILNNNRMQSVIPWSRILSDKEILLAINTDYNQPTTAWVTIDNELHSQGDQLRCIYSTDKSQIDQKIKVEARNGKAVLVKVPAAGFVIFE
ncbi:alpha-amylase family glycosyl hydrolase [Calothrix sp. NIES-2098]|uniref:alpha-amylase family glycosyl hydrolase n=1 Tax=Calothrix sp. NIES-2098 TaxID=1954171 RepID=UPI000B61FEC3|nr:alpha-amylase [Calothrix sp. NIES-2098]